MKIKLFILLIIVFHCTNLAQSTETQFELTDKKIYSAKGELYTTYNILSSPYTITDAWWEDEIDNDNDGYTQSRELNARVEISSGEHNFILKISYKMSSSNNWLVYYEGEGTAEVPPGQYMEQLLSIIIGLPNTELEHGIYEFKFEFFDLANNLGTTYGPNEDVDFKLQKFEKSNQDGSYKLVIEKDGNGFGRLKVNGVTRELPFEASYEDNDIVKLEAITGYGGNFIKWHDFFFSFTSSDIEINVPIRQDVYLYAEFNSAGITEGFDRIVGIPNLSASSNCTDVDIDIDESKNIAIAWEEYNSNSEYRKHMINFQIYDSSGNEITPIFLKVNSGTNSVYSPKVFMTNKSVFVFWTERVSDTWKKYYVKYSKTGSLIRDKTEIENASISIDEEENITMAYTDDSKQIIYVKKINDSGNEIWNKSETINNHIISSLQIFSNDNYGHLVGWHGEVNGAKDIYFKKYNKDGTILSEVTKVTDSDNSDRSFSDFDVSINENGRCVIVWKDERIPYLRFMYYQVFDEDNFRIGENKKVWQEYYIACKYKPTVAMNEKGYFVVSGDNYNGGECYIKPFFPDGTPIKEEMILLPGYVTPWYSENPKLIANGNKIYSSWLMGYTNDDKYVFTQVKYMPFIQLRTHLGGENLSAGEKSKIKWQSGSIESIDIFYSVNNGLDWVNIVNSYPAETQEYEWLIPSLHSDEVRIKISYNKNSKLESISNESFSIQNITFLEEFNQINFEDIKSTPLTNLDINFSENENNQLPVGKIIVYKTNEGRYGKLIIIENNYETDLLSINWKTYNGNGNIFTEGSNLEIPSSYTCDLDSGRIKSDSKDFWFNNIDGVEKYFVPQNGALWGFPSLTSIEKGEIYKIPKEFTLKQNYPNPFNPSTKISYSIPIKSYVSLQIYDLLGKNIRTLVNREQLPGYYEIQFKDDQLSSGIYFYRLIADDFIETEKMILLR